MDQENSQIQIPGGVKEKKRKEKKNATPLG